MEDHRIHLNTPINERKWRAFLCLVSTVVFGTVAHGYFYFGLAYSHDSLLINWFDSALSEFGVQIANGRFLQPVYMYFRGGITSPWVNGLLAMLFIAAGAFLITELFDLRSLLSVLLLNGILIVNASVTFTTATYCVWLDLYMLAFLFAVLSVWMFRNGGRWALLGAIPAAASVALYQAHVGTVCGLLILLFISDLLAGRIRKWKDALLSAGRMLLFSAAFAAVYFLGYYLACRITGMPFGSSGYQSGAAAMNFSGVSIPALIMSTYRSVLKAVFTPAARHPLRVAVVNALLLAFSAGGVVGMAARRRGGVRVLLLPALLLLPFALNAAEFVAKGVGHAVMHYPLVLLYLVPVWFLERAGETGIPENVKRIALRVLPAALFAFLMVDDTLLANGVYLKKRLEYDATMQTVNRIVDRLERTEGFVPGKTKVAFLGELNRGPLASYREGFDVFINIGAKDPFSITYPDTMQKYFTYVLNYPVIVAEEWESDALAQTDAAAALEPFPAADCSAWIDGQLVFRLS